MKKTSVFQNFQNFEDLKKKMNIEEKQYFDVNINLYKTDFNC